LKSNNKIRIERIIRGLVNSLGEKIGYCQGMNFLAANLYQYLKDEEVFFLIKIKLF